MEFLLYLLTGTIVSVALAHSKRFMERDTGATFADPHTQTPVRFITLCGGNQNDLGLL